MRLVIVGPSRLAVITALTEMGIPHVPFLRGNVAAVHDRETLDRVRGMASFSWCSLPEHDPDPRTVQILSATSRQQRSTGELPFHEAIARVLAWRIWHEC